MNVFTENAVLTFQNIDFDVVDIHNIPWLRGSQIADALGASNPRKYIYDIYDRNADEFTDEMTQLVELDTAGGPQQVRIFSPRGCYLIGMLAKTELAKEFRKWVLDVLEGRQPAKQIGRMTIPQILATQRQVMLLLKELKLASNPSIRRTLHAQLAQSCRLLAIPVPALADIGKDAEPEKATQQSLI